MSSPNAASRKKKDQIHFVNARPSTESEKLNIQRTVRAHVGKWISDQTRDRSAGPESLEFDLSQGAIGVSDTSRLTVLDEQEPLSGSGYSSSKDAESYRSGEASVGSNPEQGLVRTLTPGDWRRSEDTQNDNRQMYNGQVVAQHAQTESIERIGCVWDPFHTYPSHYPPEFVYLHEDYSLSILWPFLTPDSPSGSGIVANSTWFPLSLTDSTLFTAFLFSSLSHKRVRWRNRSIPDSAFKPQDLRTLQMIEIETIELINQAVQDPTRAASDAVLLSVLCMAHNTSCNANQCELTNTPFTAPLQRLQWLDVYGSLTPNIVHVRGLIQMVMLRGGVEKIELAGLPSILSFSDILTASSYLARPVFPWMPLQNSRRGQSLQTLLNFAPVDIESGFGQLHRIGFTPEMSEAFQAAYFYTKIVDDYVRGEMMKPDLTLIVDQRNLVHHTILLLPSASDLRSVSSYPGHTHTIIYEACRLAALVYSVGVIFPLPSGSSPLRNLAHLIQAVLQTPKSPSIWTSLSANIALLWVLALGGIAAENHPERGWFVNALGHAVSYDRITCWDELRAALHRMLWFDAACEQPGQRLWGDVERHLHLHLRSHSHIHCSGVNDSVYEL